MIAQSKKPITYIIDYSTDHLDDIDGYISRIAEAPPHLLHVGHDAPFHNTWGAMEVRGNKTVRIPPEGIRQRIERIKEFTSKLHDAGVQMVLPYICNQTIAGNPETREGIWDFYDHWDEYAEFGFGPRPPDPLEWLAREPFGRPHYNYEKRHKYFVPLGQHRYAPCMSNPHYRRYQKAVVENIARAGYDGVFVDNCIENCYCMYCQAGFQEYVEVHIPVKEQREVFGFEDPSDVHLGTAGNRLNWVKTQPTFVEFLYGIGEDLLVEWLGVKDPKDALVEEGGNGWLWNMADRYLDWMDARYSPEERLHMFGAEDLSLWGIRDERDRALWAETKLFWAKLVADNLKYIKEVGERIRPNFLILPNWGEMQHMDGNEFREEIGHDLREWAPRSDYVMFEESNEPGRIVPGVYMDYILQLKFAHANGVKGAILNWAGTDPNTVELCFAECLSGLGSFIQHGTKFPQLRRKYREFQDQHADLLEGWAPHYEVGLAYFYNQLHLENLEHMREVYKFTRYFSDQHVLFHYLTEEDLWPKVRLPCRILVLPQLSYLTDDQASGVENFLAAGGICFATGPLGRWDAKARQREEPLVQKLSGAFPERFLHGPSVASFIPDGKLSLDDARRFSRSTWKAKTRGTDWPESMRHLDEELGIQKYFDGGEWARLATQMLERVPALCPSRRALGVRFNAYRKGNDVAVHIVNYNVDLLAPAGQRNLTAVDSLRISLQFPEGVVARDATCMEPGCAEEPLDPVQRGNTVELTIPQLSFYKLVLVRAS